MARQHAAIFADTPLMPRLFAIFAFLSIFDYAASFVSSFAAFCCHLFHAIDASARLF